jgi:hypothetical protein
VTAFDQGLAALRPYLWTVRDPDGVEYDGHIDGYLSCKGTPVDGDIGEWEMVLPGNHHDAPALLEEGAGIVVRPQGSNTVLWSGQVDSPTVQYDASRRTYTFTGNTDECELAGEPAWPDPAHWLNDPAGNNVLSGTVDARSGPAEDVLLAYLAANLGFHDAHVDRRRPYLIRPASLHRGTTVDIQANLDLLLDLAKTICRSSGITWRIAQGAPGQLNFQVRARADVSADVIFSRAEGSVTAATFTRKRPSVTQGITYSDDGTSRTWALATDAAAEALWRRRWVAVGDAPSSIIADELQAAGDLIAAGIEQAGATLEAVVLPAAPQWGTDYQLGDLVTVVDDTGVSIVDQLKQMTYTHEAGSGPKLVPSVGYAQTDQESALVPVIRDITGRLRTIERRRP